jgi:hypothetical protein
MLMHFKFEGGRTPTINPDWLAELEESANSSRGLIVTTENGYLSKMGEADAKEVETLIDELPR